MDVGEDLETPRYKNWVRGTKAVEYLQEGLRFFVGKTVFNQRDQTLQKITSTFSSGSSVQCNQCSVLNLLPEHTIANKSCDKDTCIQRVSDNCLGNSPKGRRKCPNGICSILYDEIVHAHRFKDPKWKNTDASTWCFDQKGWSFAKCFQTTPNPGTSSTETDASGLLSIVLNDDVFQTTVACNLESKNNVFAVARQISIFVLCRRSMEVEESELNSIIDIFIAALQDPKYLIHDPAAKQAVQNLLQLKNNQIQFSLCEQIKVLQVRKDALLALEHLEEADAVALWEGHGQIVVAEIEGIKSPASEKFSKLELQTYIQQTLEKMQQLTIRGQNLKKKSGVIVDTSTHRDTNLPLFSDAQCTDSIDSEQGIKRVIDKAWNILIDYMKPDPVLDCAMEYDLLGYRQTRDIREEKNTSEKNRKILGKVRSKVKTDYGKLKTCLIRTDQARLVKILECIERGQDTSILLEEIHAETKCETPKVNKDGDSHQQGDKFRLPMSLKTYSGGKALSTASEWHNNFDIFAYDRKQKRYDRKIRDEVRTSVRKKKGIIQKLSERLGFGKARRRKVLKRDLIDLYRRCHNTIPLSPLIEEEDAPLTRFYVLPKINKVEIQRALGGGTEVKTHVGSLHDVFYNKGKLSKEIYLTANAGLGKTSFSKRLALAWCQAHNPIKSERTCFSDEEIDTMRKFEFLFLLLLRQSTDACDIDDLIMIQIIPGLAHTSVSLEELELLFSEEMCLVILDGLDEWTHPVHACKQGKGDVPHRKARECTVLTTSRPWKLSVINTQVTKTDLRLELVGLDEESANILKMNVISLISGEKDQRVLQKRLAEFNTTLREKEISNLQTVPLLLTYLLCLWCDEIKLGETQCEIYSNILELLFSRTIRRYKDTSQAAEHAYIAAEHAYIAAEHAYIAADHAYIAADHAYIAFPRCFCDKTLCKQFYSLLKCLAHLAFHTLFSQEKESTLVFDNFVAEKFLNDSALKFCLLSGILTKNKVQAKLTKQEAKMSFAHKTMHEFFAALYMHIFPDDSSVISTFLSHCNSIKNILEMSKVYIFLCGIDAQVASSVSRELIGITESEETTQQYRSMTHVFYTEKYKDPLKEAQHMQVSCMKENPQNPGLSLYWNDLFIDEDCLTESYYKHLQLLAVSNKENLKSVSVDMAGFSASIHEVISHFGLADMDKVDKVYYRGPMNEHDIISLFHSSVKCLSLISCKWQDHIFIGDHGVWSPSMSDSFYRLENLSAINIDGFDMRHGLLEKLAMHLSSRNFMHEIELENLHCTDHKDSCTGFRLDLSRHESLRTLALSSIPLSDLDINVSSLEECFVGPLPKPGLTSRYLNYLPLASKLERFLCSLLDTSEDIETMLNTLLLLVNVKQIYLWELDLSGEALSLSSKMVHFERLLMADVTMNAAAFHELLDVVQKLPQSVRLDIGDCNVTPEKHYETIKKEIKESNHWRVLQDEEDGFVFETIKDHEK